MSDQETAFPPSFIWGSAASSTQCEGAAPASDWLAWEQAGKAPASGNGNGFAERYAGDFRLLKEIGLDHHRLSIEWARIEPHEGERDRDAIKHYHEVLEAAERAGISIWVCLHHFTLPKWFTDSGGFLGEKAADSWRRHVEFINDEFGASVFGWQPINEPAAYAAMSYLGGMGPPGVTDLSAFQDATRAIYIAWRDAWQSLSDQGRPVSTIHNLSPVFPADPDNDGDRFAADLFDRNLFGVPLRAIRDGVLEIPGREPEEIEGLAGSADYIGFSYYSATAVSSEGLGIDAMRPYPPGERVGPMRYAPWPEGIGLVIDRIHGEVPSIPILVVENGIGTDDDTWREEFLTKSLKTISGRISGGADVRGFFHWTACDNYEWLEGFGVRFGIIDMERNVKPSARVLTAAIRASRESG